MRILIIEDEQPAFTRLSKLVREVIPTAHIEPQLDSVKATIDWLAANKAPDLAFLDIHLADGSAFDLLKQAAIPCPLIFTTAFDQYALQAFKTNSLDYLLKPVKKEELQSAVQKLQTFGEIFGQATPAPTEKPVYKKRFLIRFGEHIRTLPVEDIAYCYSENKSTFARSFDGRMHPLDQNLDALEHMLDPQDFFRINRQYIISLKAIDEMKTYTKARVIIRLNPPVKEHPVVSSERSADFKEWLAGEK